MVTPAKTPFDAKIPPEKSLFTRNNLSLTAKNDFKVGGIVLSLFGSVFIEAQEGKLEVSAPVFAPNGSIVLKTPNSTQPPLALIFARRTFKIYNEHADLFTGLADEVKTYILNHKISLRDCVDYSEKRIKKD